jgi:hypothetical protein
MAKRLIFGIAGVGGGGALAAVHLGVATPDHVALAAALAAGGITVIASLVAALKSVSTDKKVDNITVLVDGRYGDVLRELADVRGILAQRSGAEHDIARAASARQDSNEQEAKVEAARNGGKRG